LPVAMRQFDTSANDGLSAARRRALALLAFGLMLSMTTWFSTSAVLPELRRRWDLSTNEASVLVVSLQLGFVAGALVSAIAGLADRWSPRTLIAVGAAGAATSNALIVVVDNPTGATAMRHERVRATRRSANGIPIAGRVG
jgi:MFS family permease